MSGKVEDGLQQRCPRQLSLHRYAPRRHNATRTLHTALTLYCERHHDSFDQSAQVQAGEMI